MDFPALDLMATLHRLVEIALAHVTLANALALTGALMYVATLMVRTIVPLRIFGIISMLFFIAYGAMAERLRLYFCI